MTRYARYEILYTGPPTDEEFEDLITDVYEAILFYSIEINDYLKQCAEAVLSLDGRTISDIKKTIDSADERAQYSLKTVEGKCDQESLAQILQKIDSGINPVYHLTKRLLRILSEDNSMTLGWLPGNESGDQNHIDIQNKISHLQNPGEWLRKLDKFKEWRNSKVSCGIWLKGALEQVKLY
ncbi:uncharacterized protein K444DRAFT_228371 [Hyaloscypha bicolor E]|uniref:Uncharacterized protein n=1 Tax=Hyaloscypha bicolor E TaxID=1095630 RepID=A0A2J6SKH2_9HELO|nr:uncharacterized protein K444DRAFT_228371 [Hyaloscypha bicolor E]PMD51272.1 hypothetical protein K444DRAFT_228371 [Hyaloscypha bicolor E]